MGVASMRRSMLAETADFMQLGLAPAQVRAGVEHDASSACQSCMPRCSSSAAAALLHAPALLCAVLLQLTLVLNPVCLPVSHCAEA